MDDHILTCLVLDVIELEPVVTPHVFGSVNVLAGAAGSAVLGIGIAACIERDRPEARLGTTF
jgi:hypothetical protein